MSDPVSRLLRWLVAHDLPKEVALACPHTQVGKAPSGTQLVVWDACLKEASVGIPAQLLALGINRVTVLDCPQDAQAVAAKAAEWESITPGLVARVAELPRSLRHGPETLRLGQIPVPRRVMLGMGFRDDAAIPVKSDDTDRTLAAIELLTAKGLIARGTGLSGQLGGVRLSATGCVACGVCVRACPTGALELIHQEDASWVVENLDRCRTAGECVRLCPEHVMWMVGETSLADLLDTPRITVARVPTAACTRCGMRHPSDEGDLCRTCTFRAKNPFGSVIPPQ